jgi:hypothetical protein
MFKCEKATGFPVDPLVSALTQNKIDFDVQEYLRLLDTEAPEQAVHDFLAAHTYFFNGVVRLRGFSPLYSKVRLGTEYEVDFACFFLTVAAMVRNGAWSKLSPHRRRCSPGKGTRLQPLRMPFGRYETGMLGYMRISTTRESCYPISSIH